MKISQDMLRNRAYTCMPTQFSELRPEMLMPEGVTDMREMMMKAQPLPTGALVQENGDVIFRMIAKDAKKVTVLIQPEGIEVELANRGDGVWEALFPFRFAGPKATEWRVDGTYVLHPYAPIYYSYSHPVNYVDIPDVEMDYVLIRDVPHGTVCHEYFWSKATENFETSVVYVPPGYETGTERYPVLYLQHGAGEGETSWIWNGKANFILDNLIAEGKCKPFIVVMNNGMIRGKSETSMSMKSDTFAEMLLGDCMPYIEGKYRVLGDKWNRAMAGLSMGSMQTSAIGMTHPELFGYLGLFSGFMRTLGGDESLEAQPHLKCLQNIDQFRADYRVFFRGMGEGDGFWETFVQDDAICERFGADPAHLDTHIRRTYPGVHDWNVWRRCLHDFAQLIF